MAIPTDIDIDKVFANLDDKRQSGALSKEIVGGTVSYQASQYYPGMIEMVFPDGTVQVGEFVGGAFRPIDVI